MKIFDINLPNRVYKWVQERYAFYDKKDKKYTGEKYTEQIFKEASEHFKLSLEDSKQLYNESIQDALLKGKKDKINTLVTHKLDNKKVKLNSIKILSEEKRKNPKFRKFVEENKDEVFTAITDSKMKSMYTFKENDTWIFYEGDLIEIN